MRVTRETLMAFVDGALAPDEERRVDAEVAKDPALARYVEQQRKHAAEFKAAFAPVLEQPVPERIERMVLESKPHAASPSLQERLQRMWREHTSRAGRGLVPVGALAAGILVGLALNGLFATGGDMRTEG